jgi:hypothetical protein
VGFYGGFIPLQGVKNIVEVKYSLAGEIKKRIRVV